MSQTNSSGPSLELLVGMKLCGIHVAVDMLVLSFGSMRSVASRRGDSRRVGDLALHIQSQWWAVFDGEVVAEQRACYDGFKEVGERLQDTLASPTESGAPVALSVNHDLDGALSLVFSNTLSVGVRSKHDTCQSDTGVGVEWWRVFRPFGKGGHLVFGPANPEGVVE